MNNIIKRENGRQPATFGSVVDQIFQNNLNRFDDELWTPGLSGRTRELGNVPVNIKETDKTFEMELYAPGLTKQDFHLNMEGDLLTISFNKKTENKQESKPESWVREEYKGPGVQPQFLHGRKRGCRQDYSTV